MIFINRKRLIFIIVFLIGTLSVYFILTKKDTHFPDLINKTINQQEIEITEEETIQQNEDEQDENNNEDIIEDPVKDFISDALKQAVRLLFNREMHIVAIGDSLTQGVGDELENEGYVGILNEQLNKENQTVHFTNFGKRGNRTDQLLKRLDEEEIVASLEEADIILITIGANDVMKTFQDNITNLTLEAFAEERIAYGERLHDIFIKINEINPKLNIYLIGFFNPFYQFFPNITELEIIIDSWNIEGERMTEQYNNISFIPIKDIYDTVTVDYLADDNFHPNHYGYQLMAERILNYLTEKERSIYDNNE